MEAFNPYEQSGYEKFATFKYKLNDNGNTFPVIIENNTFVDFKRGLLEWKK